MVGAASGELAHAAGQTKSWRTQEGEGGGTGRNRLQEDLLRPTRCGPNVDVLNLL